MLWDDIQTYVEQGLGQECRTDGRFTPTDCRLLMHEVQAEIAEISRSIITSVGAVTVASTETYDLPETCFEIDHIEISGHHRLNQLDYKPVYSTAPTGTPTNFYLIGDKVGFAPVPDAVYTYITYYRFRPPEFAFRINHENAYHSSTAATMSVGATGISLIITGGTDAGTTTITYASYTTVATMVARINALSKGFTATAHPAASALTWTTQGADVRSLVNIEGKDDYCFFNPRLEYQFRSLIGPGTVARWKLKDRELSFEQYEKSMYYQTLKKKTADWKRRNATSNNQRRKNVYRRGFGGASDGKTFFVVN